MVSIVLQYDKEIELVLNTKIIFLLILNIEVAIAQLAKYVAQVLILAMSVTAGVSIPFESNG